MRYALYIARHGDREPQDDMFCVLDSVQAISDQVADPSFGSVHLTFGQKSDLAQGAHCTIMGDDGAVCIRPFEE